MTFRIVPDVNTLASAAVFPRRTQGRVVALGLTGHVDLALSDDMMQTLLRVLDRPYFAAHTSIDRRDRYLTTLRNASSFFLPDERVSGVTDDEEDDIVLGTAVAAGADYLITGDHGLLRVQSFGEVSIVTARQFLTLLEVE